MDGFRRTTRRCISPVSTCRKPAIASRLRDLLRSPKSIRAVDSRKGRSTGCRAASPSPWPQNRWRRSAAPRKSKVMVITGGPGTGKTTIIHAILRIFSRLGVRILLAAPTGRAAKRMSEATGHEAKTIHRLLEYSMQKGGFQRNEKHPLECDLLVVDEASMIDTILMHHLLKALPAGGHAHPGGRRQPAPLRGARATCSGTSSLRARFRWWS